MPIARRYFLHLCPDCGEQFPYAGACDSCQARLIRVATIPVQTIQRFQDRYASEASPVPVALAEFFVKWLLEYSGEPDG